MCFFFQVCQDATVVCMLVTVTGKYQPGTLIPRKENVKNLISLGVVEVIIDLPLNTNVTRVVVFVSTTVNVNSEILTRIFIFVNDVKIHIYDVEICDSYWSMIYLYR